MKFLLWEQSRILSTFNFCSDHPNNSSKHCKDNGCLSNYHSPLTQSQLPIKIREFKVLPRILCQKLILKVVHGSLWIQCLGTRCLDRLKVRISYYWFLGYVFFLYISIINWYFFRLPYAQSTLLFDQTMGALVVLESLVCYLKYRQRQSLQLLFEFSKEIITRDYFVEERLLTQWLIWLLRYFFIDIRNFFSFILCIGILHVWWRLCNNLWLFLFKEVI